MPVESVSMRTRVWSRRLRRNVWTAGSFVVLVLIGGLVSWRIHKENAPQEIHTRRGLGRHHKPAQHPERTNFRRPASVGEACR